MEIAKYKKLMSYLKDRVLSLNKHEYDYSLNNPQKRNPEIHNIVQTNFPITLCRELEEFSVCWNLKFEQSTLLYERCFKSHPENFHTGNANDILQTLYDKSRYPRSFEDYKLYLRTEACCYIIQHKDTGYGNILRIDLYRQEDIKQKGGTEFTGGLFHCLHHFSIKGQNLYDRNDVNDVPHIFSIVCLIGECFVKKGDDNVGYFSANEKQYCAHFFQEADSNVYFLKSMRRA